MSAPDSTRKRYFVGTHRVLEPEETWERVRPLLPRVGITRLADVTALDRLGIPVFQAVRPAGRNLSVSQGKGATPAAARASAAMEAIELWHAEDLAHLPTADQVEMTPREMRYANAVPLSSLRWSAGRAAFDGVPLAWVRARPVAAGGEEETGLAGWLPRSMLELDFDPSPAFRPRPFHLTSSGLASGNCREEALLHALCELVERHALHLARRHPEHRAPLAEESVDDPWCREAIGRLRAAGCRLALADITWEVGIPTLVADLALPDLPQVWRGSGCHPSPAVALSRALTEAAQSRLTYISGARDDIASLARTPWTSEVFETFVEPPPARRFGELVDVSTGDVGEDLAGVARRLRAAGYEPFYVDLGRDDVGVAVVFAFVPGLEEVAHG